MFKVGVCARDHSDENPMADIERTRTASRDRVLSNDEMVAVWNGDAGHPFNAAIKLLLLTAAPDGDRRAALG